MPLPSDLDILRCCVSRTVPCRYTVENGRSPRKWYPAMIIRATQKNRISGAVTIVRSEEHTSELQSRLHLVCRLLLEKKKQAQSHNHLEIGFISLARTLIRLCV